MDQYKDMKDCYRRNTEEQNGLRFCRLEKECRYKNYRMTKVSSVRAYEGNNTRLLPLCKLAKMVR
jgi:hypothetical protein